MIKINIISNNKVWLRYIKSPDKFLKNKIKRLNKNFKKYKKNSIIFTLLLSGESEVKKLNKHFRKKNKSTDVLSFPFHNKIDLEKKLKKKGEVYLGDIIININKIKNKNDETAFKYQLDKLWVHGLVHLFGYDHKKNSDFIKMERIEKKFLSYLKND